MVDTILVEECQNEVFIKKFEQIVLKYPKNIAVKYKHHALTYLQLNTETNKLATYLQSKYKISHNELIGIMADRSETMVIGILAILKCGCAFVPIEPNGSHERFHFVCSDTAIKLVLFNIPESKLPSVDGVEFIDLNNNKNYQGKGFNLDIPIKLEDIAYVMYTSGSTGIPKGVLIKNENLVNFIAGFIKSFNVNNNDTFLQISNFLFDSCISEIFVPLTCGGCVVIPEKGIQSYPERVINNIHENGVSIIFFTPVMLQLLLDYISSFSINPENFKSLRRIITGGETVTLKLTNLFNDALYKATGTGLTVAYGPTETTVWVTVWDWTPQPKQGIIPIGKPTANVEVYILDDANIKVTDGDEGEIVIAGKTVGLGYLNREEINKEKFVPNPYREGETMYKTGDKGRILPDGNIEFLGRFDNMVKLNGTRIELSEVEKNILKLDKIKECIVLMKLINNANELVVYFTTKNPEDDEKQIIDEILIVLNSVLPSYSIPNFFVKLDSFLINANGKIDRKNLPTPRGRYFKHDKPFTGPTTETEKKLTNIIEQILNAEHVSIDDPIFNIGVKSILVTKILILIKNVFNTTISVSEFFQYPTIRVLSLFIDNQITGHSNPFTLLRPGLGSTIFLIPGYLGDQFNFADFVSNYSLKQPLYSIDFSNVKGFDYHTDYLSVFAKELIAHIKTIQPLGPYFFVGYSLGGLIAYEIACQLQQNNNKVALLAIVGSTPPYFREGFYAKYSILRELNIFLKPNLEVILKYFKYRIPHIFRVFNNKVAKSSIELVNNNSQEVTSDTLKNSIDYKEGSLFFKLTFKTSLKFKGDALIIYENLNKTRYSNFNPEEYYIYHIMPMMWKRFVKGKVDVHLINSLHEEILIEPYAAEVAKIIEDYFDKRTQDEILNWVKFKLDIPFKT